MTIIGAPSNVQPGDRAQLRAISRADDGGLQDVSQLATWRSSDDTACTVSAQGMVEGRGAGTATLTASYSGMSAVATVTCGYIITALVHENAPTTNVTIAGARVEVEGGILNGRTFEVDANGRVTLPPVAGPGFALNFKHRNYDDVRLRNIELPRQTAVDVGLLPAMSIRFEDGGSCSPERLRVHTFRTTRESRMRVSLSTNSSTSTARAGLSWVDPQGRQQSTNWFPEPSFEMVGPPAEYTLVYEGWCASGAWQVILEHAR